MREIELALAEKCHQGEVINIGQNKLHGYFAQVTSYDQIERLYLKMKIMHSAAMHIVCSFRIPGEHTFECEDYCDDNDYSCGRNLLQWMKNNQLSAAVLFVVRYAKEKLSEKRFSAYIEAAISAMKKDPMYEHLDTENQFTTVYRRPSRRFHRGARGAHRYIAKERRGRDNQSQRRSAQGSRFQKKYDAGANPMNGNYASPGQDNPRRVDKTRLEKPPRRWTINNNSSSNSNPYYFANPQQVLSQEDWPAINSKATRAWHQ